VEEEQVFIFDFGSQYTRLIAKAVRELGVRCRVVPAQSSAERIRRSLPRGLVLSGGPESVYEKNAPQLDPAIYDLKIPILAICYGLQRVAADRGGQVVRGRGGEYGLSTLQLAEPDPIFAGLEPQEPVWMSHGDQLKLLPPGFRSLARSAGVPYAAIRSSDGLIYGLQFHPEVAQTPKGKTIFANWLRDICRIKGQRQPGATLEGRIGALRRQLEGRRALMAFSGGVDSASAAALTQRAIGSRLLPVFVDSGLLRQGDRQRAEQVAAHLGLKLAVVEAQERFFAALSGLSDPEDKRKAVGEAFIRAFEAEARRLEEREGPIEILIQGTIYSDVIESAGAPGARRIKSHHNVGGLPEQLGLKIVEPLRDLFKDEVRQLALKLGIPEEIIWEQPFPGPGLAVRILGPVTPERVALLRQADAILRQEIKRAKLDREIWQYFAVLLPGRSVAIRGDGRGYGEIVALRAVSSREGMTADWYPLPHETLTQISSRLTNELDQITRVVYDITAKPPATIEWE